MVERRYPSKVLLFGEYTVLHGGSAFAIPFHGFEGNAVYDQVSDKKRWDSFFSYLRRINHRLTYKVDIPRLLHEVQLGLDFQSNIPVGQGVGSSAALSAFVYENFTEMHVESSVSALMADLAEIESFFHGRSSGFDPLISLLDRPLKSGIKGPEYVDLPTFKRFHLYLIGPSNPRVTSPLVQRYKQKMKAEDFKSAMHKLTGLTNSLIETFLQGDVKATLPKLKKLSLLQKDYFPFLITPVQKTVWKSLSTEQNCIIKLCGAGGGGFLLAFSVDELPMKDSIKVF